MDERGRPQRRPRFVSEDPAYSWFEMRVFAALAALVAVSSAGAATTSSGLRGAVTRGPIVPACAAEQPCDGPAKNVTLAFVRNGRLVRRVTTNEQGRYRVALAPGLYAVRLTVRQQFARGLEPTRARVVASRFRRVDFSIDTGIR
jgi:hypothetical protein